jgi:hypothetical protein
MLSSNLATPGLSFSAALRSSRQQKQRPQTHQVAVAGPAAMEPRVTAAFHHHEQQARRQSVGTLNVNSSTLDNMLRIVPVVQQFTSEFNCAVSEEEKIVAIKKIVLDLMKKRNTRIHWRKLLKIGHDQLY